MCEGQEKSDAAWQEKVEGVVAVMPQCPGQVQGTATAAMKEDLRRRAKKRQAPPAPECRREMPHMGDTVRELVVELVVKRHEDRVCRQEEAAR